MFRSLAGRPDARELFAAPNKAVGVVNDALAAGNDSCMFVTLLLATLDMRSGQLIYVRAGHVPPFHRTGDDAIARLIGVGGPPLGLVKGFDYRQDSVTLSPSDRLLVVTDGFTEANDPQSELFGEARIETFMADANAPGSRSLPHLVRQVHEFEAGRPAFDDKAAILLTVNT